MSFIFTGESTRAIQICHIPLTHPGLLLQLLDPIRQQLVFNELITSCLLGHIITPNETNRIGKNINEYILIIFN